ncbi:tetratricopeptide repeat protein [uncultured Photobacterium sp.]|uniref:tetratricopeptide repeat protein n=1 Tax=uncultured Photobacterium sp. TaxID=173973 RepID=UPI002606B61A|nr:tetratricopeptide repeat protein [uncultured Photobacterium sp.]
MSEINKKLNALSQNQPRSTAVQLQAATVRPVPKNPAPRWAVAGLCIAVFAGGTGWWLGSHRQAKAEFSEENTVLAGYEKTAEQASEQKQPPPVASVSAKSAPLVEESVPQVKNEPVPVKPKSAPKAKVIAKTTELQKPAKTIKPNTLDVTSSVSKVNAEISKGKQAVLVQKVPSQEALGKKTFESKLPKQNSSELKHVENQPEAIAEGGGLTIETVELDAGQLANVEYKKAQKAWEAGDSRKAIGYLESALKYQPEWVKARQKLSALYYGRGETRQAISALQQGLMLDAEQPDLRLTMAKLLANESQPQAALNVLSRLPVESHSGYLAMRGALAQQLNNNEMAMSSYQQLVKEQPYDGRWWMGLGIALERSSQVGKARDAYKQALLMGQISSQSQQFIQQRLTALDSREG